MNPLDLYANIEQHLDFQDEIRTLHKYFLKEVLEQNIQDVLDVGCGQGEFLETLKLNQVTCSGIDLSQSQIDFASKRGVDAQCVDLKDITEQYPCLTAIFDVINYIPKKELEDFFRASYRALQKDGIFIFDINSLFGFEDIAQGTLSIDNGDKFINIEATFNDNKLYTDITVFEEKENNLFSKEQACITQHYHSEKTLSSLFKKIGFEIVKIDQFNLHSDDEADKLIYTIKKV